MKKVKSRRRWGGGGKEGEGCNQKWQQVRRENECTKGKILQ